MVEVVKEEVVVTDNEPAAVVTEVVPEVKPGEKTEPSLLLKSLQQERDKVKQLEADLLIARNKPNATDTSGEVFSDEGKVLDSKIAKLEAEVLANKEEKLLSGVQSTFPVLKDKSAEFQQFRADNPGMRIDTAAKAYLIENDLLDTPKPRKGLESSSGGGRAPVHADGTMTAQEADDLRVNNYNEYARRIKAGTLKIK